MRPFVPWLAALGAGGALALALPKLAWWPLGLLFSGLVLAAVDAASSRRQAFLLGGVAGTAHWALATWWVVAVMHDFGGLPLIVALICLLVMALILGFTWALAFLLTRMAGPWWRPWLFPLVWIALESARQLPPYLFPWNSTAAACSGAPWLLSSLPVWGASGLGWALVAAGSALYAVGVGSRRAGALMLAVVVGITAIFSVARPPVEATGSPLRVALLQPGTGLEEKWDPSQWPVIMAQIEQLTRLAVRGGVDMVLWPESAVPMVIESDVEYRLWLTGLAREVDATLVVNSIGFNAAGQPTNSVYLVTGDGVVARRYDKLRLVPFGEYVPRWARVAFTEGLVREVGSFTPGTETVLLNVGVPMGMALCYEVVFADLVAAQARAGAELLATITNDGWYGDSWAPPQHFAQAVLRAAENRRFMLRAALTGISGVIDPTGRVLQRIEVGATGFVVAEVQPMHGLTLRSRFGDWWAVLCVLAAVVVLWIGRERKAKRPEGGQ